MPPERCRRRSSWAGWPTGPPRVLVGLLGLVEGRGDRGLLGRGLGLLRLFRLVLGVGRLVRARLAEDLSERVVEVVAEADLLSVEDQVLLEGREAAGGLFLGCT